jgi:hypothetical protein
VRADAVSAKPESFRKLRRLSALARWSEACVGGAINGSSSCSYPIKLAIAWKCILYTINIEVSNGVCNQATISF